MVPDVSSATDPRRDRAADRRPGRAGAPRAAARGGHPHDRRGDRRGSRLHRRAERVDGRQHRGGGADGARRLPQARRRQPGRRPQHPARSDARGRLRVGPRRGPQRALDGRAAGGLPGRRAGGLAGARVVGGAGRGRRRHHGPVRRAGVRLHRRAVRLQCRRAHRRALDERPGPRALPGAAGSEPVGGSRSGRAHGGRRAGRLDRAVDADGGAAARGAGPGGARVPRVGHPPGRRGPAGRGGRRGRAALAAPRPRRGGDRPGTCSGCSTGGRPWSGRPAPGCGHARRTSGRPGPPPWRRRGGAGRSPRQRGAPRAAGRHRGPGRPRGPARPRARAVGRLRPATRERLEETLRSWLLHQGRRDAVAAELHVHAQTVRYRMGQLRELFGDTLDDPSVVLDLVVALAAPAAGEPTSP